MVKLVYEKVVEGVRHLFGSATGIPAAGDTQLSYKDIDGDSVTPLFTDSFVDDGHHGMIRVSDEKFVAAYVGNECIIPGASFTPKEKVLDSIKVTKKPTKLAYIVGEKLDLTGLKVQATFTSGDKEIVTEDCTTSPDTNTALATTDTKVTVSYTSESVTKTAEFAITVTAAE